MRPNDFLFIATLLMFHFIPTAVQAQVPAVINYQGRLTDDSGNPINGTSSMEFRIYSSSTGGSALWAETKDVIISNGVFNVLLGSSNPFPLDLFDPSTSRFLEIRVDGDALTPRQLFASVPYAFTTSAWIISGSNMYSGVSGKVGIGTDTPRDPLGIRAQGTQEGLISFEDPSGNTKWHLEQNFGGNTPGLNFVETGVADFRLFIGAGGNVGIGTGNPNFRLDVRGTIGNNATLYHSDERWKKHIQTISHALNKVSQLRGVRFVWRADEFKEMNFNSGKKIGLIAQEVEKVIPEVVSTDKEGFKSVEYAKLTALLVEAVKELKSENQALKERIEALEKGLGGNKSLVLKTSLKTD